MKRLHVSMRVRDMAESVAFYSSLFDAEPTVEKLDYAKWMLDDPHVNFVIEPTSGETGVDHLGIQTESEAELDEMAGRIAAAGAPSITQKDAVCCYAKSDKHWVRDPQGLAWETFFTHGKSLTYGPDTLEALEKAGSG